MYILHYMSGRWYLPAQSGYINSTVCICKVEHVFLLLLKTHVRNIIRILESMLGKYP